MSAARPAYAAGLRASLATVVPLAAGQFFGLGGAGTWMSLGGFNGALSDRGGAYRTRAQTMALLLGTEAVAVLLGTLASGHFIPALLVTFCVAFAASVLRVWGNPGVSIGGATLTVYVVALAFPPADAHDAVVRAGYLTLGGLWAMAVALVLWPLRPYRPARLAIADCYEALAEYVEQVAEATRMQETSEWQVQLTPATSSRVRMALESARDVLVQLRRGRPGAAERGEQLLVIGESADQIFGHVVAMGETLAPLRGAARNDTLHECCATILRSIAATAREIAVGVEMEQDAMSIPIAWSGAPLRELMQTMPSGAVDPQYEHAAVVFDQAAQFASAASLITESLNRGGERTDLLADAHSGRTSDAVEPDEARAWLDMLRSLLSPGSLILRFAVRVAIVTTIAVAMSELLQLKRGYWVTITVIVILQPYTGVTLTRAVQRVLGTVLGALLAAGLGAYFHDPHAILVIATVFVACCVALLPLNYAAFSVFLTPTFVLLAEASAGDWNLAETRVMDTLLGGALALAGARFLWPIPERARFPSYASAALRANGNYLRAVVERFDDRGRGAGEYMRSARRSIGLATVNAEESLQRALVEAHGDARKIAPALTLLAYTRRCTATVAALALARHTVPGPTRAALEPLMRAVEAIFEDLAAALDEGRQPQAMPTLESRMEAASVSPVITARVDRLSRQTRTLHDAVARMTAA